jgi:L-asparaginase II
MSEPLVAVTRGTVVDAIHRGDAAFVGADGYVRATAGDPGAKVAFWRSSAKPFQAIPLVASGAADRWGFSAEDVALVAGSHNGEPVHVERAESMLARIGRDPEDLVCGAHPPLDLSSATALAASGQEPTVLHSNCSGKHIGMLALAEHLGADHRGYHLPDHPAQRAILETIARFAGVDVEDVAVGIDGCGVPCFGTPVEGLALAFARLMEPTGVDPELAAAAAVVRNAMVAHPYLVAGRDRLDTDLMQAVPGIVSKGGAAGVEGIGLPEGVGFAVKIEDGAGAMPPVRPAGLAALAALCQAGALDAAAVAGLERYLHPAVTSVSGEQVGEARAVFELTWATARAEV